MEIVKGFRPLGLGIGAGTQRDSLKVGVSSPKLWIGAALSLAGGLASSLIGGNAASKAAKRAEKRQRQQEAEEDAWYRRRYNEDYLDTAAGQNLARRAKEMARDSVKRAEGAQAVAGGTAAATQMAKDAANKMVGDTIADIAAADTDRKANVDNIHMANRQNFAQQDMARELQRSQNISNAAQQASNALFSAAGAIDQIGSPKTPNLQGSDNKSKVVTTTPASTPVSDGTNPFVRDGVQINPLTGEPAVM